jgi:hypothetical protein
MKYILLSNCSKIAKKYNLNKFRSVWKKISSFWEKTQKEKKIHSPVDLMLF